MDKWMVRHVVAVSLFMGIGLIGMMGCRTDPTEEIGKGILTTNVKPDLPSPVSISFQHYSKEDKGYIGFHFRVEITNPDEAPRWFLFKQFAEESYPKLWFFSNDAPKRLPFRSYLYRAEESGEGQVIMVHFIGQHKFMAVRVPPKGKVQLGDLMILAKEQFRTLSVLMARELYVNGAKPLNKWLPYEVTSSEVARIPESVKPVSLDFSIRGTRMRDDYPKEDVKFVQADYVTRWDIPIVYPK